MNKPTEAQKKFVLQQIELKMKQFEKIRSEIEQLAEEGGVTISFATNGYSYLTYYPKSPWEQGWWTSTDDCEGNPDWPKSYEGWMSSTDECNAY